MSNDHRTTRSVFTIGASAGGLAPVKELLSQIPADLDASLFLVLHMPSRPAGHLVDILSASGPLAVKWAEDQETGRPGTVYVAPADRHLVLNRGEVRVLFGPRECRARPAVDVLFRSAAAAYGSQVVGIVLSGKLDDGARGLRTIKRCGGFAMVMDPALAQEPEMPHTALREAEVDQILAPDAIGSLIPKLAKQTVEQTPIPEDVQAENQIAQRAMMRDPARLGSEEDAVACPDCGGNLKRRDDAGGETYRCRVGHTYGVQSLLNAQQDQLEQAIWVSMRILMDRERVLERLAEDYRKKDRPQLAQSMTERANELAQEYQVLRNALAKLNAAETMVQGETLGAAG